MPDRLPHVTRLLHRLRSRQKLSWVGAAWMTAISAAAVLLFLALVLEAIAWFEPSVRLPVTAVSTGLTFFVLFAALVATVILLLLPNTPSDDTLARWIWAVDEGIHDRLLNALQLARREDPRTSAALRQAALEDADAFAKNLTPKPYLHLTLLRRASRLLGAVAAVVLLGVIVAGGSLRQAAGRLVHPSAVYLKPGRVVLALEGPDTLRVVQGETATLQVRALHARPRGLRFVVDEGTGLLRRFEAVQDSSDTTLYTAALDNVQRDASFYATSGHLTSDTAQVVRIARPRIARIMVTLHPPAYTGQTNVTLPVGVGDITALPGTGATFDLEASRPLASATLMVAAKKGGVDSTALHVDRRTVSGRFAVKQPGRWWVNLVAEDGVPSDDPVEWDISALQDQPPRVEVRLPEDGAMIPDQLVVPLVVVADDDYGISRMRLRYRIYTELLEPDSVGEEAFAARELEPTITDPGRAVIKGLWPLSDLPLLPTDEVHYFVEVWDNDAWSGPKRARTETRRLVFPSVEDLFQLSNQQEQDAGETVDRALQQAEETKQKLEETLTRMKSNPDEVTWEETRALQQALDQQDQMLEQMQDVAKTLEQMQQQAQSQNLLSGELLQKYKKLQEMMEDIATPEMKEAMENLRKALDEMDGDKIRDALEQMAKNQDELMEKLDRSLSIFERLQMEKRLDELARRAEDLAKRQAELSERMENASPKEAEQAAVEQERIQQDLDKLADLAKETAEKMEEMHGATADSLDQLEKQARDEALKQDLQQSQSAMQQGKPKQAKGSSQMGQQKLEQLAQQFRKMQQSFSEQGKQEVGAEMDRLFARILLLSRRQEALLEESRSLGVASPRYPSLAADQEALREALGAIDKDVAALMKQSFFVGAQVAGDLQRARGYMDNAIGHYTNRVPREVTGEQAHALAMLHLSLLRLNDSQQQMQQSSSGTGYQEMMEALQKMAAQQQALNQGSQGMPMPMPGGQGGQAMLQQMAARQRALAEQMRRLEQQSQSMEEILGKLDGLGNSMDQVAKDLENQNITDRTKRLQQRIVQRLLDSQRSLQERDHSRQRVGRVAEGIDPSHPGELPPESEDLLRQRMLRALEGDYARPWRDTIRDYFRALEKDRAGSSAPADSGK